MMLQTSHSFLSSLLLVSTFLFLSLDTSFILLSNAAITTPLTRNGDFVEQNGKGTWCFYPTALSPSSIDIACVGSTKGDYGQVMAKHLNTTTSINYFSASLERLGGSRYVVGSTSTGPDPQNERKIYMCLSGRAGDYSYQTMCTTVGRDNSLGNGGPSPYCKVEGAQRRVTDGCYIPNQPKPTFTVSTTRRPAVVTVTRSTGTSRVTTIETTGNQQAGQISGSPSCLAASGLMIIIGIATLVVLL